MSISKETELFQPIKDFFVKQGFIIQGEVKNCDIVCLKGDDIIVIELKKSFNLKLLYQAMDRFSFSNYVYIAINRPKNFRKKEVKHMLKILQCLNIGLIAVALDSPTKNVDIILTPTYKKVYLKSKKRKVILNELQGRNLQVNLGGSCTKNDSILTAHREQSIFISCVLQILKTASPKLIKQITNIQNSAYILRANYFGYFQRVERGIYSLSQIGINMLSSNNFKQVIDFYKKEVQKGFLK